MFVETFIHRPILATVCSLVIILAGAIAIPTLPIAQFPELAPPQVQVTAFYNGANAQTVETAVTTPLEQAINGIEGMQYITSTSGNDGTSSVIVTFDITRNLDIAAVPSLPLVEVMYCIPSMPLTACSIGLVTAVSTVSALAPL